jgi:hypothetical protein
MKAIKGAGVRFLRGPAVSRLLARFGIDAKRYWLLMDLFGALSDRHDMLNQLGSEEFSLKLISVVSFVLTGLGSLLFLLAQPHLVTYYAACLAFPAFLLLGVLISETGNSVVNPVEGLVLAHQPVNGATYTAAKLSHLLRIVLYLVAGMNLAPALAGLALNGARWYYPIVHMLAAFALGLTLALACCAAFGWLMRFVPPARMKSAAQGAMLVPWVGIFLASRLRRVLVHANVSRWLPAGVAARAGLAAAFVIAVLAIAGFGIRALSADYLIRVSEMMHGGVRRVRARTRRPRLGDAVAWLARGQAARGGFEYVSRMMRRDWQFRRQIFMLAPLAMISAGAIVSGGLRANPFSRQLTMIHGLPHIVGMALFTVCIALPYGSDHKGSWIFLAAPAAAFARFARGVFALLWLVFVAIPHVALFPLLAWLWGMPDALLFLTYSAAAASAYLSMELRLIDGVPFTQPPDPSQGARQMLLSIVGIFVLVIAVGVQYFVIFRSRALVAVAAVAIGAAAWIATRRSLRAVERTMRFRLGLLRAESGRFYREVE